MKHFDLSLYLVLDPDLSLPLGMVETARMAVAGGVTLVQLRDKNASTVQMIETGRALKAALHGTGVPLIVNDDVEAAIAIGADGLHVGQGDMDAQTARRRIGPDMILGVSVQTVGQAKLAEAQGADYLGVGAMFPTGTKLDADAVSLAELQAICQAVSIPVVAIGGITKQNLPTLQGSGICGVALVSAIFASPDIRSACGELKQLAEELVRA